jgi:hypothetical protein
MTRNFDIQVETDNADAVTIISDAMADLAQSLQAHGCTVVIDLYDDDMPNVGEDGRAGNNHLAGWDVWEAGADFFSTTECGE